jgi:hypothetical protein
MAGATDNEQREESMSVVDSDAERQTEPVQIIGGAEATVRVSKRPLQGQAGSMFFAAVARAGSGSGTPSTFPTFTEGSAGGSLQKRKP